MAAPPTDTAMIGLDWGTTSFRAYRFGADGRVLDRVSAEAGILNVPDGNFEAALRNGIAPWLAAAGSAPILACGMIGSRQGWHEAPYVELPAGEAELAAGLASFRTAGGLEIHFVPGLCGFDPGGVPDVMRGEETQILGAVADRGGRQTLVLPGTHSKWAMVEGARITRFATFMTGEVFAILKRHSILGRLMTGAADDPGTFQRGVDRARSGDGDGGLLHRLFGCRSLALFGELPEAAVESYLSGLLIGTEIEEARRSVPDFDAAGPVVVVGSSDLTARYADALALSGVETVPSRPDAAAAGLYRLAAASNLLRTDPA